MLTPSVTGLPVLPPPHGERHLPLSVWQSVSVSTRKKFDSKDWLSHPGIPGVSVSSTPIYTTLVYMQTSIQST